MVTHHQFKQVSGYNKFSGALMKQSSILFREAKVYSWRRQLTCQGL